ncbi:thiol-disulfide oxidoreductase DCC family protein [Algicola sagamiensis]|uniref:thiol-disulfide oxidoreductase DCC family protein n=1 Tax=Algicola sagamiensis TaxID=163869 RepID=UPI000376F45C|nr:thiol-disulfide oxidoreductase DCC family protein [Algicola sagamiensis]
MTQSGTTQILEQFEHLIVFDGLCHLCSGLVRFLIQKDTSGLLYFCPAQSESGRKLLTSIGQDPEHLDTFVYFQQGTTYLRSDAFFEVLKMLPKTWQLFRLFQVIPRFIRDPAYNLIAKNRYRIAGKRSQCLIPTKEEKSRFII